MSLPRFSVQHSIFGNMLTLFVLVGGLIMVMSMQRDTFPEMTLDLAVITTSYPSASAEEVEDLITNPIEDEIRDIEGIDEITSSSVEGISAIVVKVDPDARYKERVFTDIQRKVDQVRHLPEGAETPEVEVVQNRGPMIRVCVTGTASEKALRDYGDYLKDRIKLIPGVGTVLQDGWRDEEFWVEVDLDRIEEIELSLDEIVSALARRNINRPGGKLPDGSREIVLRTVGQFHTAAEIGAVVVRSNTDGDAVRVRDVATVRREYEEDTAYARANGHRTMVLGVKKKLSGDTILVADAVKELLEREQVTAPDGVALTYVDDESFYVKRRLKVLSSNGMIGFVLVVLILFLFLNFRVALITGIGIPFSFMAALLLMSFFGITINLITMFGLILVLGMVVDDAIIVGENVFRYMEEGVDPKEAAVRGTTEVMYPVIATVLTTVVAFLPLIFAPDFWGDVMMWFPIVVAMTLSASLLEVLLILPCHVADFVKPLRIQKAANGSRPAAHRWMARVNRGYSSVLRGALRFRYLFMVAVLALFVGMGFVAAQKLRIEIFPADLIDIFMVRVTAPQGTRLEATENLISQVEQLAEELPEDELENIVTYVGGHIAVEGGFSARGTQYASMVVYLTPQNGRDRRTQTIVDELRARAEKVPGIDRLEFEMVNPGPPTGKALEVKISGPDYPVLLSISQKIQAFLHQQAGVFDIQDDYEKGKEEVQIRVNEQEAARLGLDVEQVARTVLTAFQGIESTIVREGNDEVAVRVRLAKPYREQQETLQRLTVRNRSGRLIPLSRVTELKQEAGLPFIFHYDGERVVTVSANIDVEKVSSSELNQRVEKAFAGVPEEHPGYALISAGEWKETKKLTDFMENAFLIAMLLIYIILAVQFDSFMQPFVVMISIPFGLVGVILALIAHHMPVSIMAMMGMVGLSGVVVNDAIVLIDFINKRRRTDGVSTFEAIVEAGQTRLRPILLTSITTIAGLVPVIYGIGGYEPFIAPAGVALAYGLAFATVLTLLIVPVFYHIAFDVKRGLVAVFARRSPTKRPHVQT